MTSRAAKASARKSLGEYKPLIKYAHGRTEVAEQSPERAAVHTKHGVIRGDRYARGTTYARREDAIAAAQALIDLRLADALRRRETFIAHGRPLDHINREIETWGGAS